MTAHKTLTLLRHAKAVPGEGMQDHERPLAPRGVEDARRLGAYLREAGPMPEQVLCSTALRTRQTLDYIQEGLGASLPVEFTPRLYMASPRQALAVLAEVPAAVRSVLVIGHNPTLHQLAFDLSEHGNAADMHALATHFPTATLAEIHYPATTWDALGPRTGTLARWVVPATLLAGA